MKNEVSMKTQTINALECATRRFASAADLDRDRRLVAVDMSLLEEALVENFGMTWEEIEDIEIQIMQQM